LSLTEHTLREGVYRCTGCNELHLDASDECVLECDADMEPVEVVAASQLRGAVDALEEIAAVLAGQETTVEADETLMLRGIVGDALIAARGQ
jgi:hypothetical protein